MLEVVQGASDTLVVCLIPELLERHVVMQRRTWCVAPSKGHSIAFRRIFFVQIFNIKEMLTPSKFSLLCFHCYMCEMIDV